MKKALYIQPVVKTQEIETEMVIAMSLHDEQPSNETGYEKDNNFAKKAIIWERALPGLRCKDKN